MRQSIGASSSFLVILVLPLSILVSQMQGGQPARKSSFYAVIDYVRHRLNFSAAATWVLGLLPMNHVGGQQVVTGVHLFSRLFKMLVLREGPVQGHPQVHWFQLVLYPDPI